MRCLHHGCVVPLHDYYRLAHVEAVAARMRVLGPPVLRAAHVGGRWYLREGTHRARAALQLGYPIHLRPMSWPRGERGRRRARFRRCLYCHHSEETMNQEEENHAHRLWLVDLMEALIRDAATSPVPLQAHKARDPLSWLGAMLMAHAQHAAPERIQGIYSALKEEMRPAPAPPTENPFTTAVESAEDMTARIKLIGSFAAKILPRDGFVILALPYAKQATGAATASNMEEAMLTALLRHVLRTHEEGTAQRMPGVEV